MAFDIEMIKDVYSKFPERINKAREILNKPLSLAEKILYAHLWDGIPSKTYTRGKDFTPLYSSFQKSCKKTLEPNMIKLLN